MLPISTAPEISQNVAKIHAALMDSTPEPTLVPNEFATSLAPIPNARINAIVKPRITIHRISTEYASIILLILFVFAQDRGNEQDRKGLLRT